MPFSYSEQELLGLYQTFSSPPELANYPDVFTEESTTPVLLSSQVQTCNLQFDQQNQRQRRSHPQTAPHQPPTAGHWNRPELGAEQPAPPVYVVPNVPQFTQQAPPINPYMPPPGYTPERFWPGMAPQQPLFYTQYGYSGVMPMPNVMQQPQMYPHVTMPQYQGAFSSGMPMYPPPVYTSDPQVDAAGAYLSHTHIMPGPYGVSQAKPQRPTPAPFTPAQQVRPEPRVDGDRRQHERKTRERVPQKTQSPPAEAPRPSPQKKTPETVEVPPGIIEGKLSEFNGPVPTEHMQNWAKIALSDLGLPPEADLLPCLLSLTGADRMETLRAYCAQASRHDLVSFLNELDQRVKGGVMRYTEADAPYVH